MSWRLVESNNYSIQFTYLFSAYCVINARNAMLTRHKPCSQFTSGIGFFFLLKGQTGNILGFCGTYMACVMYSYFFQHFKNVITLLSL